MRQRTGSTQKGRTRSDALTFRVEQFVEHGVKDFAMKVETERRVRIDAGRVLDAARSR